MSTDPKQKTIKQHFVPQRYLKGFQGDDGALWVYDKRSGKAFKSGTRAVAFENSFYDFPPGCFEGDLAEQWNEEERGEKLMQAFEREQARVLDLLVSEGPHIGIRSDMRQAAAFVMTIQFTRTATFRRHMAEQQIDFFETLFRDVLERNRPDMGKYTPRFDPGDASLRQLHLKAMVDHDRWREFGALFESHHWMFCIAQGGAFFLTSDNPVSRRPYLSHLGTNYTGIGSEGIEIVYPLNRHYALLLRERTYHRLLEEHDRGRLLLGPDSVNRLNWIIAANCERFLFGPCPEFSDIDRFFEANRILRERSWERWATKFGKSRRPKGGNRDKRKRQQEIETYLEHVPINWDP